MEIVATPPAPMSTSISAPMPTSELFRNTIKPQTEFPAEQNNELQSENDSDKQATADLMMPVIQVLQQEVETDSLSSWDENDVTDADSRTKESQKEETPAEPSQIANTETQQQELSMALNTALHFLLWKVCAKPTWKWNMAGRWLGIFHSFIPIVPFVSRMKTTQRKSVWPKTKVSEEESGERQL